MPTSAPGNRGGRTRARQPDGFTLIELLIVIAIVALTTTLVALAVRDGRAQALEREADRLSVLLDTARAESRASGLPVWWRPAPDASEPGGGFRFVGLPSGLKLPTQWLDADVRAELDGEALLPLGPEALIGSHRIWLTLGDRRIAIVTDGLGPFEPQAVESP